VAVVVWVCSLIGRLVVRLPEIGSAAVSAMTTSVGQRVERASGISPELIAAIRASMPADGRLVLYSPYGGKEFEFDATDARGELSRQVRGLWERMKNLLYPMPRDVHFARDPGELQMLVDASLAGRLLVVDGTQGPGELTVGGRYELVFDVPGRVPQLRVWRLRGRE
jgi:hypothetical protein